LQSSQARVMVIDAESKSESEKNQRRYLLMDSFFNK
jgi:hypothetical protein